ncbi:MAG TPA: HD domain-containing protein [Nitrososphaeraceae archaeon]|nr:HD domain-containing protein [Nitrososphaeraceae archaeon]
MDDVYKFNNLIEYLLKLKNLKRTGWISKAKILRAESVADHSYSLTALSMVFSDLLGLDTEKVMKMCIIHDLAESIIGDYMPEELSIVEKKKKEDDAMEIVISSFPDKISLLYSKMWKEFSSNQTKEARLVKQLDKVEMFLQANYYLKSGYSYEFLSPFLHVLDNIGSSSCRGGEIEEKDDDHRSRNNNNSFQSSLENILKHLR